MKIIKCFVIANSIAILAIIWWLWSNPNYTDFRGFDLRVWYLENSLERLGLVTRLSKAKNWNVDFSESSVQTIDDDFYLSRPEQESHLTGVKFRGLIINSSSVSHKNVKFKITSNDTEKEFYLNEIKPGQATSFEVYLPDISIENSRYAKLKYVQSVIGYTLE